MNNMKKNVIVKTVRISSDDMEKAKMRVEMESLRRGSDLRYFIRTFGCQQNENDSEKIAGILEEIGFVPVDDYENADLVIINTCSIRENADQRLFGHLGQLKAMSEQRPSLMTIVCGCLPTQEQHAERIKSRFSFVNSIFGPSDIWKLPRIIEAILSGAKTLDAISEEDSISEEVPILRERKDRALVSIMYGCNNFCTYCVVPYTRGRERSRKAEDILNECREIAAEGIPEIMLLGQNVNAWGFDLFSKGRKTNVNLDYSDEDIEKLKMIRAGDSNEIESFAQLLTAISAIPGISSVRYMSSHPRDFTGELIAALYLSPEIENHLHLPMQSGSDQVLKKMNRHYDMDRFKEIVNEVRKVRPKISLSTDIIVGFPYETESDFDETLMAIREIGFDSAFTFIYSPRSGTVAANWEQIPSEIQHERFDRLAALMNEMSLESNQKLVGQTRTVLVEGVSHGDKRVLTARDSEFHLINVNLPDEVFAVLSEDGKEDFQESIAGKFIKVIISEAKTFSVEAEYLGSSNGEEFNKRG